MVCQWSTVTSSGTGEAKKPTLTSDRTCAKKGTKGLPYDSCADATSTGKAYVKVGDDTIFTQCKKLGEISWTLAGRANGAGKLLSMIHDVYCYFRDSHAPGDKITSSLVPLCYYKNLHAQHSSSNICTTCTLHFQLTWMNPRPPPLQAVNFARIATFGATTSCLQTTPTHRYRPRVGLLALVVQHS